MMKTAAFLILLTLSGCGLRPLYLDGGSGTVAQGLSQIEIAPVAGRTGYLLRDALKNRLGNVAGTPRFRLNIVVDDEVQGFGVRADDAVTREQRRLRTRYQLVDVRTGETVLDATAGSDAGIDVVSSEYATVAAENTAVERLAEIVADQMVGRLALFVARTAK